MTFTQLLTLVQESQDKIGVCSDSRQVTEGDVFVAVAGSNVDGHEYIGQAIEKGAGYVVAQREPSTNGVPVVMVDDSAKALGELAQARYGNPASRMTSLAVTGTNGKTTVAYIVRSIISCTPHKCGMIGTVQYDTTAREESASLTTPDSLQIARLTNEMVENNARFMAIEASSHALDQERLAGLKFTAAAFTNLSGDHLDYHESEEEYLAAKTKLFRNLPMHAVAVLNAGSPHARKIAAETKARVLWYGIDRHADIIASIHKMDADGTTYGLHFNGHSQPIRTKLLGKHNVANQLAAAGLCIAAGFDLNTVARGIERLERIPGRLDPVESDKPFKVLVDYAHTDDALANVLATLRPICEGELTVVFGAGGDRDKTKRARMAKVAEEKADSIYVTSDNPRTEDPGQIIDDILAGFADADKVTVEQDRKKAIELAVKNAKAGDVVLIAGKGHETYQVLGTERIDFDDREVAAAVMG
ncbi:UDP-N-acetylmuramoyl-L-alanyl-D-glutamate--2,6-diaminopimelate ligase [Anaerohalosphaera lusitana]|uniref:UDP-N-acetylmuramoyl-L-alanyl-D-glutamate--2,6-diaminopimelate ligase n=1 Tax=Anaerohalosphaera lusitana TaxID=1936003 RepID=A0A1U9NJK1_9BACT|nr:UDP-N-acetylmuramoyl-L-alanyl-D-glutamate--2,6-diaminopimelate ligase [Anaerohalosphaera lusitana]AQT67686.1 UDP-N-acetylmuramoyl-L-alanyl-D-glutamate--2,6-diaminopimelate ligase [Anaerohalosphaera lusitana]